MEVPARHIAAPCRLLNIQAGLSTLMSGEALSQIAVLEGHMLMNGGRRESIKGSSWPLA